MNRTVIAQRAAKGASIALRAIEALKPDSARSKGQQRRRERERQRELAEAKAAQLAADRVLVAGLHKRLIDLHVSIKHRRHHDDLASELDDILYELKKENPRS